MGATTSQTPLRAERVLAEARAMIAADGVDRLSLRPLARRLGVTAPSLYQCFPSKDAIVRAVADAEFDALLEAIDACAAGLDDPIARIKAQSRAYVARAVASPALFAVMFAVRPPWADGPDASPRVVKAWEVAAVAVEQAIATGRLRPQDPALAALTIWSAVHGVAMVQVQSASLGAFPDDRLVDAVIDAIVDGLAVRHPSGPDA